MTRQENNKGNRDVSQTSGDLRSPIIDPKWTGRSTFSVEEAGCEILGLSKCSAYAAAKDGTLPTVRIGRRLLVPRLSLEKLLSA
jgi:excisionase family DNA binding protein